MSFSGLSSEDEGFDDGWAAAAGAANEVRQLERLMSCGSVTFMQNSKDLF